MKKRSVLRTAMARFFALADERPAAIEFEGLDAAIAAAARVARLMSPQAKGGWKAQAGGGEIAIFGELTPGFFDATGFLAELAARNGEPVTISIMSPGGDALLGIALYNALVRYSGEVTVRIEGIAASAASLVAMGGDKIVMPENAWLMIHTPYSYAFGRSDDFERVGAQLKRLEETYAATYAARSGQDQARVTEMMEAETYLDAAQAVELGFADETEQPMKLAARLDPGRLPGSPPEALARSLGEIENPEPPNPAAPPAATPAPAATPSPLAQAPVDAGAAVAEAEKRARNRATEIADLCELAGRPDRIRAFLASEKTMEEIRAELRGAARPAASPDARLNTPSSAPARASADDLWNAWRKPRGSKGA